MELTRTERAALAALQREIDYRREEYVRFLTALKAEDIAICHEIEARLGLPEGAIGREYAVDKQTWTVIEKPTPAPVTAEGETT